MASVSSSQSNPMLEIVANLARSHREHERFYAEAPLHKAIELQRASRALKALAERWSETEPLAHPLPVPFAGAADLNDDRAIESAPANPPSTGRAGSSVSFMNRWLCSLESQTTEIRYPPSVGPATCAVCPSGSHHRPGKDDAQRLAAAFGGDSVSPFVSQTGDTEQNSEELSDTNDGV